MDKNELVVILNFWRDCAIYNIFSQQSLHEYFKYMHRNNYTKPFELPGVDNHNGNTITLDQFIKSNNLLKIKRGSNAFITRNWLKETFRLVKEYAVSVNKLDLMKKQDWYHFVRINTNAFSHNLKYEFNSEDKKALPITYKGHEINSSMEGQYASLKMQTAYETIEDIISFSINKL